MCVLTSDQVIELENDLLALQEQVLGITDLVASSAETVELDQNRVGRISRMGALQGQAMAQASSDRQAEQLVKIERSLDRMDEGGYGRCFECDQWIVFERLKVQPVIEHCLECAQSLER